MNSGVTFLLPCLNEEKTIGNVITEIQQAFTEDLFTFEILVVDNGSTDQSVEVATSLGARVFNEPSRGYGSALASGIRNAQYEFVVMGDADQSYRFGDSHPMLQMLDSGFDLVIGNRFLGGIEKGAMPFLHRFLGNPVLTFIGKRLFRSSVGDFHCGLRAFRKTPILRLGLKSTGMEFATEMIVRAEQSDLRICQVPVVLRPDGRNRPPHLRTWRDGWRHLRFLLVMAPNWVFLPPAFLGLLSAGMLLLLANGNGAFKANSVEFSLGTSFISLAILNVSVVSLWSLVIARTLQSRRHYLTWPITETTLIASFSAIAIGFFLIGSRFRDWMESGFSTMAWEGASTTTIIGTLLFCIGGISIPFSLLLGVVRQSTK
jgi:glycosyltransferase involved in cell wall biosynthesis